jgi:hypothetical protein
MKPVVFISLLTLTAALPTNVVPSKTEHLVARDPQRGRGGGGFGGRGGGGFGGLGNLGGSLLGGLGSIVSVPLELIGDVGGGLIGGVASALGGLLGGFLPFRVNADGTYEIVEDLADANVIIAAPAAAPATA